MILFPKGVIKMLCKNCGTEFEGNFCTNCGDKATSNEGNNEYPPAPIGEYKGTLGTILINENSITIRKSILFSKTEEKIVFEELAKVHFEKGKLGGFLCIRSQDNLFKPISNKKTSASDSFSLDFSSVNTDDFYKVYQFLCEVVQIKDINPIVSNETNIHQIKICMNCGDKLLEKAIVCPVCKNKNDFVLIDSSDKEEIERIIGSTPHSKCDYAAYNKIYQPTHAQPTLSLPKVAERPHKKSKRELKVQAHNNGQACCPRCGSVSLSANKKGFGVVKAGLGAVAGGFLTGGVGAIVGTGAGNINAKKVWVTCLNCGKRWKM